MFQDGMGAKREQLTFGFYPSPLQVLSTDPGLATAPRIVAFIRTVASLLAAGPC